MNYIADLHIHSPFSRATSPDSSPAGLAAWARIKGIQVIGTGDCTHPGWFKLLKEQLEPAEPGLFRLKNESSILSVFPEISLSDEPVRFLLSAEISSIYKKSGFTRKVHNLLYLPDFVSVERLNAKLAGIGNIESDGRPILGLDSRNLLEILLECSNDAFLVPAHIWTPWFSLFGSKSGFDSIEECFGDLSSHIFALETGLSSDPDMNRLVSGLDHCALISNSDCHSPSKLGREANLFNTGMDFFSLRDALKNNSRDTFAGTVEFYPEEGKYHFDGHRDCKICLDPKETRRLNKICPVCGKQVTVGVHYRVLELADRKNPYYPSDAPVFYSLIPLPELIAELLQVGASSKQVLKQYSRTIAHFGSEFNLLLNSSHDEIFRFNPILAESVIRMREGRVIRQPGYDGEFGVIRVFDKDELKKLAGQTELFDEQKTARGSIKPAISFESKPESEFKDQQTESATVPFSAVPNQEQQAAVMAKGQRVLVKAGPGTGKTFTLTARLQHLLEHGAAPERVVAITFTNRTADELKERLTRQCGSVSNGIFIGTFHSFCLENLRRYNPDLAVIGPDSRNLLLKRLFPDFSSTERSSISKSLTSYFNSVTLPSNDYIKIYMEELARLNGIDLDAVIPDCVNLFLSSDSVRQQMQQNVENLFVDEFQDLNSPQYQLIELLSEKASVFAIGDPDQAIYGFRGADIRHFMHFADLTGTVVLPLKTTYRLPDKIVQAAGSMISRNRIKSGLDMTTADQSGDGTLEFYRLSSPEEEAELIVRRIEELIDGVDNFSRNSGRTVNNDCANRLSFADFAVLYRLGQQADVLSEALSRRGIPYQLVGATPYYLCARLRPLYYLLQAAAGTDDIAIWLLLFGSLKGIGTMTTDRLEIELPLKGDFLSLTAQLVKCSEIQSTALKSLNEMVFTMRQTSIEEGIAKGITAILKLFGLEERDEDVLRLLNLATAFGRDLSAFSNHLQRYASETVYDRKAEAVSLMSCHSSKGLEFPVVFITGLEEGLFPCTMYGRFDIEEERRLFYVALTRSSKRLVLTSAASRSKISKGTNELSRFVAELPAELFESPDAFKKRRRKQQNFTKQMQLF